MVGTTKGSTTGPSLSAVILAGGKSTRMGTDKSFLTYHGTPFLTLIADELAQISDDLIVVIGDKDERDYAPLVGGRARIARDAYNTGTPLAGLATGLDLARHTYSAAVGCDTPLVMNALVKTLQDRAVGHSGAVPVWRDLGRLEPLLSVYSSGEGREAARRAMDEKRSACVDMISLLRDVALVDVAELRRVDAELLSFLNINSRVDYDSLLRRG